MVFLFIFLMNNFGVINIRMASIFNKNDVLNIQLIFIFLDSKVIFELLKKF